MVVLPVPAFGRGHDNLADRHAGLNAGGHVAAQDDPAVLFVCRNVTGVRTAEFFQQAVRLDIGRGIGEGRHAHTVCPGRQAVLDAGDNVNQFASLGGLFQAFG